MSTCGRGTGTIVRIFPIIFARTSQDIAVKGEALSGLGGGATATRPVLTVSALRAFFDALVNKVVPGSSSHIKSDDLVLALEARREEFLERAPAHDDLSSDPRPSRSAAWITEVEEMKVAANAYGAFITFEEFLDIFEGSGDMTTDRRCYRWADKVGDSTQFFAGRHPIAVRLSMDPGALAFFSAVGRWSEEKTSWLLAVKETGSVPVRLSPLYHVSTLPKDLGAFGFGALDVRQLYPVSGHPEECDCPSPASTPLDGQCELRPISGKDIHEDGHWISVLSAQTHVAVEDMLFWTGGARVGRPKDVCAVQHVQVVLRGCLLHRHW